MTDSVQCLAYLEENAALLRAMCARYPVFVTFQGYRAGFTNPDELDKELVRLRKAGE